MNSTFFGPITGPGMTARPVSPLRPAKLGIPQRRGMSPMQQIGPAMSGLRRFAIGGYSGGGHPDMGWLAIRDALRVMPNRAVPDYLLAGFARGGNVSIGEGRRAMREGYLPHAAGFPHMARGGALELAGGGDPDEDPPLDMTMRGVADERRLRGYEPRIRDASIPRDYPYGSPIIPSDPSTHWPIERRSARDRQLDAMFDLYNSGPIKKAQSRESREGLQDMAAMMLDPTMLPLTFAGSASKLGSKLLPRFIRQFRGSMPWKARAGEMGAWNMQDPNIRELNADSEREIPWGLEQLPRGMRMIGDR